LTGEDVPGYYPGTLTGKEEMMSERTWNRALPMGQCWCGCGVEVPARSFFAIGHDRRAESMLATLRYGSLADMLAAHGYGPGAKSLYDEYQAEGAGRAR
jgi:hypothetical protein